MFAVWLVLVFIIWKCCTPLTAVPDASGEAGDIQWNFEKFLIGPDGSVVARFRPRTVPDDPEVLTAIESYLPG